MTELSQTPASWLPSLESLKGVAWSQMAKYGAVALGAVLLWGVYQNVAEWFKPAPVVYKSEVTAAEFKALKDGVRARLDALATKEALDVVAGRVLKLEDRLSSKKK